MAALSNESLNKGVFNSFIYDTNADRKILLTVHLGVFCSYESK